MRHCFQSLVFGYFRRSYLKGNKVKVKGQGKLNMHIISGSLVLYVLCILYFNYGLLCLK